MVFEQLAQIKTKRCLPRIRNCIWFALIVLVYFAIFVSFCSSLYVYSFPYYEFRNQTNESPVKMCLCRCRILFLDGPDYCSPFYFIEKWSIVCVCDRE